jgi:small subunit ribosomal protein S19e
MLITNGWQTVSARADLATFKKFAPFDEDWFLIRMVSLVRHIYIRSPIGVKNVKRIY